MSEVGRVRDGARICGSHGHEPASHKDQAEADTVVHRNGPRSDAAI